MEFTHDNIQKWFYDYFAEFNKCNGNPKKVPNMAKYFTEDLQFISYILDVKRPDDREGLLNSMIHPGLLENLEPEEMLIDQKNKFVAVILRVQFKEESTGTLFPLKHNCAVYHIINNKDGNLKINKIIYFTEHRSPEEPDIKNLMKKYREQALGF